jgi:hypothetical protein
VQTVSTSLSTFWSPIMMRPSSTVSSTTQRRRVSEGSQFRSLSLDRVQEKTTISVSWPWNEVNQLHVVRSFTATIGPDKLNLLRVRTDDNVVAFTSPDPIRSTTIFATKRASADSTCHQSHERLQGCCPRERKLRGSLLSQGKPLTPTLSHTSSAHVTRPP